MYRKCLAGTVESRGFLETLHNLFETSEKKGFEQFGPFRVEAKEINNVMMTFFYVAFVEEGTVKFETMREYRLPIGKGTLEDHKVLISIIEDANLA